MAEQAESKKPPGRKGRVAREPMIVGIGASAGGLEALRELTGALGPRTGMAFVLLQHMSAESETQLPAILGRDATLPVTLVEDGDAPAPDHVYVVPAGAALEMDGGRFRLLRHADGGSRHPIDRFLVALAAAAQERAVAVILSGTGSDGALGVRDVAGAGGFVLVQDPATAAYDAMPKAAIATGLADRVLPPREIAAELGRIARLPMRVRRATEDLPASEDALDRIYDLLLAAKQSDFRQYRRPTILRRVARRMVVHRVTEIDDYVRLLEESPDEVERLYQDLLIHVTRFFRERDSFEALRATVFPRLMDGRRPGDPIRIWVPGCATGEEPYSVAMTLLDFLGERSGATPIQVFGTDISEETIQTARAGLYPENCVDDVPPELLRRFLVRVDSGYRVAPVLREMCVFARQDLLQDPPFSHIDLVVCRNVLIYLEPEAQRRVIVTLHYALRPEGMLMLSPSETTSSAAELFSLVDKRNRIYARRPVRTPPLLGRPGRMPGRAVREVRPAPRPEPADALGPVERLLLDRYAPPGVLVDEELRIVQSRGHTGDWLELPAGVASLGLFGMLREGLVHGVRAALHGARTSGVPTRRAGLRTGADGRRVVDVEVLPVDLGSKGRHFLVLFEAVADRAPAAGAAEAEPAGTEASDLRVSRLVAELETTRNSMEGVIRDLESANEELQSANEEILSSNEELQSTNEELDTTKEELQSTNEELNTVNEELHARNEELSRANSDLINLLASVQIAIVMVDADLRIRRFTPAAEKVLHLIATDIGRPIRHFTANLDCPELEGLITEVIDQVATHEREVRDARGRWFALRIRAYKNADNRIDGAILSLVDVDALKRHELEAHRALAYADAIIDTIREPLLVLDGGLQVLRASAAFCRVFSTTAAESEGRYVYELGSGQWNIAALRTLLEEILPRNRSFEGFRVEHEFPRLGRRTFVLNARRIEPGAQRQASILLAMEDVTGRDGA